MGNFLEEIMKSGAGEQVLNVVKGQMGGGLGSILGKMGGLGATEKAEPETAPQTQEPATGTQQATTEAAAEEQTATGGLDLGALAGMLKQGGIGALATGVINVIGLAKGALGGRKQ